MTSLIKPKLHQKHQIYNVAIDGPAGAGKSTVAKRLAKLLNIVYLDTGAMYRCLGLKALLCSIDLSNDQQIATLLSNTAVEVSYVDGTQKMYLDGVDVSARIREHAISKMASDISALPPVRLAMAKMQADIAAQQSCVLDGRDIGTFVLPNAQFKFFLTADVKIRAQRRYDELSQKGQTVLYDTVLNDIVSRDKADSSRSLAPLCCAQDAHLIDTTTLDIDQVTKTIYDIIKGQTE